MASLTLQELACLQSRPPGESCWGQDTRSPDTPAPPAPLPCGQTTRRSEPRGRLRTVREDEPRVAERGGCSAPRRHTGGDDGDGDDKDDGDDCDEGRSPGRGHVLRCHCSFLVDRVTVWRWPACSVLGPVRPRDLSNAGKQADTAPLLLTPGRTSPQGRLWVGHSLSSLKFQAVCSSTRRRCGKVERPGCCVWRAPSAGGGGCCSGLCLRSCRPHSLVHT